MSAIPPGWLGSIIQTQGAAARAAETRNRERETQGDPAQEITAKHNLTEAISTTDQDAGVFADGHGGGSQGRASSAPDEEQPPPDEKLASGDGLDVEA